MSNLTLRTLVKGLPDGDLRRIGQRWDGASPDRPRASLVRSLATCMEDVDLVERRLRELPAKLRDLLQAFLTASGFALDVRAVFAACGAAFKSRFDLEATLAALHREGFLFVAGSEAEGPPLGVRWAIPGELAMCIVDLRRRDSQALVGTITLKGFLEQRWFGAEHRRGDAERAADHARKIYKLYLLEDSIRSRIANLTKPVRSAFDRALAGFGGIMPSDELARAGADGDPAIDSAIVRKALEEQMLGTVAPLRLERFGLEPIREAVVVFQEVCVAAMWAPGNPNGSPEPSAVTAGIDLLSNVGRFLREVSGSRVQFTSDGSLYRASAKRIARGMLDLPGGLLPVDAQLRFVYEFCLARRLVERSGERALRVSDAGAGFEQRGLIEKTRELVGFAVEERSPQGEHYHQVRLRRLLLRILQRVEPERWVDIATLPFLARNQYLSSIDEGRVEGYFAARFRSGTYVPTESVQQVSWRLLDFAKRRLFPLGVVDVGVQDGRPVALRLSRLGAELLGTPREDREPGGERSTVIVNPDFELILFPGDDEHEVVHALDRYCRRIKSDHTHHFRLERESVLAALADGATIAEIVQDLADRSRAPLPQNVLYSLEDWADHAGLLTLDGLVVRGRRRDPVDRFAAHSRLGGFVAGRPEATELALRADTDLDALVDLARNLGFLIEKRPEDGE